MNSFNAAFIKITGIVLLSSMLGACGGGDSELPSTATSVPLPVAPGTGTNPGTGADPGTGTDPVSGTGVATVNWTPPTENVDGTALVNLSGYKIYYGTSPNSLINTISINNVGLTSYVIENLESNTTYYFGITAINSNGIESPFSNVVSKYASG